MAYTYNSSAWEAGVQALGIWGQPRLCSEILSKTKQNKIKKTTTKALTNQPNDSNKINANLGKRNRKLRCRDLPNTYLTEQGGKAQKLNAMFSPACGRTCKCFYPGAMC